MNTDLASCDAALRSDTRRHLGAVDARHARAESTYSALFGDLYRALIDCDPGRMVSAPGSDGGQIAAADAVYDELAGRDADEMRSRVAYVLGAAAVQTGDAALQHMALRLLSDLAHAYADGREGFAS